MATLVDRYFSAADLDGIEQAVTKAESQTSGEIAIQITPSCKNWLLDRLLYATLLACISSAIALLLSREENWGSYYNFTQAALWGIFGFVLGYFALGKLLKSLTTRKVVWKTALKNFSQLRPTKAKTGVLIFVSLEESRAAIIADKGIAEKVSADYWHKPHALIQDGLDNYRHAEGLIKAIKEVGAQLATHFPRQSDDVDELPDAPEIMKT